MEEIRKEMTRTRWMLTLTFAAAFEANFLYEAVKVPKHDNPFTPKQDAMFALALASLPAGNTILAGLDTEEWMEDGYPDIEHIRTGRKGSKILNVPLPLHFWTSRAEYEYRRCI
jgi:hypothetical protein